MAEVEFSYKGNSYIIQSNINEKMIKICEKLTSKINKDINTIYFLYNGDKIKQELTFIEQANDIDKNRKKMNIFVNDLNTKSLISSSIKSKEIICPKCFENCRINIKDFKINLFGCKNGHEIKNISLNEFEQTQYIDESKIQCDVCKQKNKSEVFDNLFYICNTCNKKICPLCQSKHDKKHRIINYSQKNYMCPLHNELFISYCKGCKKNICMQCESTHSNHEIIYFSKILPNVEKLQSETKILRQKINIFNNYIKELINRLNKVKENIDIFYKIYDGIINNYEIKNRNYEILQNINDIKYDNVLNNINRVIKESDINNKFIYINEIFEKMKNTFTIIYNINKNEDKIKLFGSQFVTKNRNKCKIIFENKEYELQEYFDKKNYSHIQNELKIELKVIDKISNTTQMFAQCSSLKSLPDISDLDTSSITKMDWMFLECKSLVKFPDTLDWDTSNVTSMMGMFGRCESLVSLPDISQWNTSKVVSFKGMFAECESLKNLPDISIWNTENITDMSAMFTSCESLQYLPDISKWNTINVTTIKGIFMNCMSLEYLPDISKWNTSNVIDMDYLFFGNKKLKSLPDISKWDISKVINKKDIFRSLNSSCKIPDKFK